MKIGTKLAGRYRAERLLGQGGMGSVYAAVDEQTRMPVVVKLVQSHIAAVPVAVTRFLREMRVLAQMSHPHIVHILDRGVDLDLGPFLVMERLEGADLEKHVAAQGPLGALELEMLARQVGGALTYIHARGYVHRDLKPANIVLCHAADGTRVMKLLDFGAVKADCPLNADGGATRPGVMIGTLTRMSPEQVRGEPIDEGTDVWAFGMLAFELAVGKPAIPPDLSMGEIIVRICDRILPVPSARNPSVPQGFDAWFARSTALERHERFASIREQAEALLAICETWRRRTEVTLSDIRCPSPAIVIVDRDCPPRSFFPLVRRRGASLASEARRPTLPSPGRLDPEIADPSFGPRDRECESPGSAAPTLQPPRRWPAAG
jgi:serine/threonine-protein kinase